jgi:hypothetical protein
VAVLKAQSNSFSGGLAGTKAGPLFIMIGRSGDRVIGDIHGFAVTGRVIAFVARDRRLLRDREQQTLPQINADRRRSENDSGRFAGGLDLA